MMWRVWWRAVVIVLCLHTFCVCSKGQNLLHTKRESPVNAPINRPRAFSGDSRTPVLPKASEPPPHAQPGPANYERAYLKLPLDFEANRGQAPERYAFISHGPGYALALAPDGVDLALHRTSPQAVSPQTKALGVLDMLAAPAPTANLRLSLVDAAHQVQVTGVDALPGRSNYFIGNDPGKWRTQVPHYRSVRMAGIYPGIDLLLYGNPQQLEYDFVVAPGSDPGLIRLGITGADRVALDGAGSARLTTAAGEVELKQPVAYQEIAGRRQTVESHFRLGAAARFPSSLAITITGRRWSSTRCWPTRW